MSNLRLEDGRLVVKCDESGFCSIPEDVSFEVINAVLEADLGDPGHIYALHRILRPVDKDRFRQACLKYGVDQWYSEAALEWAPVLNDDGDWDQSNLNIIWRRTISTSLIDQVLYAKSHRWYAVISNKSLPKRRILSQQEFSLHFGVSIPKSLRREAALVTSILTKLADTIEAAPVPVVIQVCKDNLMHNVTQVGPANVPAKEWVVLKPGEEYMGECPCIHQL